MAEDSLYGCGPSCSKFGVGLRKRGGHPGMASAFGKGLTDENRLLHIALADRGVVNPILSGFEKKKKRRAGKKRAAAGVAKKKQRKRGKKLS